MNHQCSARWEEVPNTNDCDRAAAARSPITSRCGPIALAFHRLRSVSYIAKPSWCSATGTTNWAPASRISRAQCAGSKESAVNWGMKSL